MKNFFTLFFILLSGFISAQKPVLEFPPGPGPAPILCGIISYNVTGGGAYCAGGIGLNVGLAGSNPLLSYQLRLNGVNVGSPIVGLLGNLPIDFGVKTAPGTYTVLGVKIANPLCSAIMTGSVTITVSNDLITPTFNQLAPICSGSTINLPTVSTNGITGTWSPIIDNTQTQTYFFTPNADQCATTGVSMTVVVNTANFISPTFNQLAPICSGSTINLPTVSTNGVTGTWSPAIDNTQTQTYFFTPSLGQCATTNVSMTVVVNTTSLPTANSPQSFSAGVTLNNVIVNGTNVKWYSSVSGGSELPLSTPLIDGVTYHASQTIGGCESNRLPVLVAVAPIPLGTTIISPSQCGVTLSSTGSYVYANLVPNAQSYRFRVKHLGTNEVQVKEYVLRNLLLSSMSLFKYDQEYQIEVAVKKNNIWENYGLPCNVRTPIVYTKVQTSQCGTTLISQNDNVYVTAVLKANGYRFKVRNLTTNSVQIIDRVLKYLPFNLVTAYTAGTAYSIEVAVINTDNTYLPYGQACTLTSPGSINKQLQINDVTAIFSLIAYPNPFENNFSIEVKTTLKEDININIYDMIGRQIESKNYDAETININDLGINYPTGVYNVIVNQGNSSSSIRMIKR